MIIVGLVPLPGQARVYTDQLGRQVSVSDNPRRVVALAASITEIIFALGQGQRLKGVTQFSNFPPAAKSLPKVGSYIHLDLERIMALRPDLCIATKDGNPKYAVDRLTDLGIPVYTVDPRDMRGVMNSIREIGHLLGASARARELVADMQRRLDRVKSLVAHSPLRPRVFLQIGIAPIVSAGSNTFLDELISRAGGQNLAAGPVAYPRFTREQVLALQPDVIIITSMTRGAAFDQIKAEWSQWDHLPASRQHRIFVVDSDIFDRPSPRMVEALETLFRLIHPELGSQLP
ncbi:MAG: cobalamin-binding protein [Deltaproteobacteria bacterium]|nr:cobalamin-binding protein [Deltaproteobacteria bacterium]MBW1987232.1 cobalamin-binding protein [Deltaproteobacteria bacterium]MBW2134287.1 cobalamin-binding protein [Deltaproteobacteria bacterium]